MNYPAYVLGRIVFLLVVVVRMYGTITDNLWYATIFECQYLTYVAYRGGVREPIYSGTRYIHQIFATLMGSGKIDAYRVIVL